MNARQLQARERLIEGLLLSHLYQRILEAEMISQKEMEDQGLEREIETLKLMGRVKVTIKNGELQLIASKKQSDSDSVS